jgi:hypothetical protein
MCLITNNYTCGERFFSSPCNGPVEKGRRLHVVHVVACCPVPGVSKCHDTRKKSGQMTSRIDETITSKGPTFCVTPPKGKSQMETLTPQVIFLAYWHAFDVAGFFFGRDCGAQSAFTMCVILIGSDKVRGSPRRATFSHIRRYGFSGTSERKHVRFFKNQQRYRNETSSWGFLSSDVGPFLVIFHQVDDESGVPSSVRSIRSGSRRIGGHESPGVRIFPTTFDFCFRYRLNATKICDCFRLIDIISCTVHIRSCCASIIIDIRIPLSGICCGTACTPDCVLRTPQVSQLLCAPSTTVQGSLLLSILIRKLILIRGTIS